SRPESIAYLTLFMARSSGHHRRRCYHADRSRQGRRTILRGDAVLVGCPPFDLPIPELVLLPAGCNAVVRLRALRVARNPSPDHVTDHIPLATRFVHSRVPGEPDLRIPTHDAPFREHRSPEDRRRPTRLLDLEPRVREPDHRRDRPTSVGSARGGGHVHPYATDLVDQ